jgi:hypothetical protein
LILVFELKNLQIVGNPSIGALKAHTSPDLSVGRRPTTITETDWANDEELPIKMAAAVATLFEKMFQRGEDPTAENVDDAGVELIDPAEEILENMAKELEAVARKYAPQIKRIYKNVNDPQALDAAVDSILARLIKILEAESGYAFDVASIYNLEDWLERRVLSGGDG